MVRLYATDVTALSARFDALLPRVEESRRARVLHCGNTPAGRQCLGAGLLLQAVFGTGMRALDVQIGAHGKPYLPGGTPFSLAHSGDYAVLATADRDVGVDIERLRPIEARKIGARFFHPEEIAYLEASADLQTDFFRIWTLKESYLKAEGCGFSRPLDLFSVLPDEKGGAVPGWSTDCSFRCYDALPDYCLTVCSRDDAFCASVERVAFCE